MPAPKKVFFEVKDLIGKEVTIRRPGYAVHVYSIIETPSVEPESKDQQFIAQHGAVGKLTGRILLRFEWEALGWAKIPSAEGNDPQILIARKPPRPNTIFLGVDFPEGTVFRHHKFHSPERMLGERASGGEYFANSYDIDAVHGLDIKKDSIITIPHGNT